MFAAIFVAMCFATVVYAKAYEGSGGLTQGLKFGAVLAVVVAGYFAGANFGTMRIGQKMAITYGAGTFAEWLIAGAIIGLVYKPVIRIR
jgi:hypothetical protein